MNKNLETKIHNTLYALDEGGFAATEYGIAAWRKFEQELVGTLENTFKKIISGKYLDFYKWDANNKAVFISGTEKFIFNIRPIAIIDNAKGISDWGGMPWSNRQDSIYIEVKRPKVAFKQPAQALVGMFEAAIDQIKSRTNEYINRQCILKPLAIPGQINSPGTGFIPCKENIIENEASFFCQIGLISNDIYKKNEELESLNASHPRCGAYSYIDPPEGKELEEIGFNFDLTGQLTRLAHFSGEPNLGNPSRFGYIPIITLD